MKMSTIWLLINNETGRVKKSASKLKCMSKVEKAIENNKMDKFTH